MCDSFYQPDLWFESLLIKILMKITQAIFMALHYSAEIWHNESTFLLVGI